MLLNEFQCSYLVKAGAKVHIIIEKEGFEIENSYNS